MEQIEQLKAMRTQAQERIEHKRQTIKKQMHALATSADAQLIKSLNPLIDKLEQSSRNKIEAEKAEIATTVAAQSDAELQHVTSTNIVPIHQDTKEPSIQATLSPDSTDTVEEPRQHSSTNLPTKLIEETAENALTAALNDTNALSTSSATLAPFPPVGSDENKPELTPAQRTQYELEKIAAQLRETISQGRST